MTRALLSFSLLLSLLSSAVAGVAAEPPVSLAAETIAAWSPRADAAVLPGPHVSPAALVDSADTDSGPTGRMGPGPSAARAALRTTHDPQGTSALEAIARAREACLDQSMVQALARAGIPFCHAAEPPPFFHSV